MRQELPVEFESRMKDMLGEEFGAFLDSYQQPREYGLRVNTGKISGEQLERLLPFPLKRIPWVKDGYFYREEDSPARHPCYAAGLYYLQEPSAMTPASRLLVEPGERVLDLCAAPGGKATALGAALKGKGLLVANDVSASRAKALLRNLELFGVSNAFVTSETPGKLAGVFEGFFDKVLVDAPCSGEGMFRKDPAVMKAWDAQRPDYFARLQEDITRNAVRMLRPGGMMLYSTCTFAPQENEGTVSRLLEECPEMELVPMEGYRGFAPGRPEWGNGDPGLALCVRIWPHRMNGEGHFLALLRKRGEIGEMQVQENTLLKPDRKSRGVLEEFFRDSGWKPEWDRVEIRSGKVYQVPRLPRIPGGIRFLRNGLLMGELKKDRFEPSQQLALAMGAGQYPGRIRLDPQDDRIGRYLRGETISACGEATVKSGWLLVCAGEFPLGWGKLVGDLIKNKYASGWRRG